MEENIYGITLSQLIKTVFKHWWIIVAATLVLAALLFVYTNFFVVPMYSTYAKLSVNSDEMSIYQDFVSGQAMSKDYAEIVKSNVTLQYAADKLNNYDFAENNGVPYRVYSAGVISSMITVETVEDSRFFNVVVKSEYPEETKIIADKIIEAFCERLKNENIIRGGEGAIIDYPTVPASPSSPNLILNTLLGALIGFVLSFGILLIVGLVRDDLDSEEWLINRYGENIPLIAVIPDAKSSGRGYRYAKYSYYYSQSSDDSK